MVIEMARYQRHVDVARLADRLAVVEALDHRQQPLALLDVAGERVEMARARVAGQRRPGFQRLARRRDRRRDVGFRPLADAGDALAARRIEDVEQLRRRREGAADEMAKAAAVRRQPRARVLVALRRDAVVHGAQDVLKSRHRALSKARAPPPSWPGLTRPSRRRAATRLRRLAGDWKVVDGRVKPGHDG